MTQKDFIRNFSAGLFFIVGVCLLVGFIFTLGKDKGISEQKFYLTTVFNNIGGLSEGAPVYLSGVTVGGVDAIGFLKEPVEGRRVQVRLNIYEKFRDQVEHPIDIAILTEGVLGEKVIQIYVRGDEHVPVQDNEPRIGTDPLDVLSIAEAFSNAADSFTKTATEMSEIDMVELSEVMLESSKALLETTQGLNGIMEEFYEITFKSKRLFDRVEQKNY